MTRLVSMTIRNYRSIGNDPVTIPLNRDSVAILGPNNCGKTSVLRTIFELRPLFALLASPGNEPPLSQLQSEAGRELGFCLPSGQSIMRKSWIKKPQFSLNFDVDNDNSPRTFEFTCDSSTSRCQLVLRGANHSAFPMISGTRQQDGHVFVVCNDGPVFSFTPYREAFLYLTNSKFFGAFRNPTLQGGTQEYDLTIGNNFVTLYSEFLSGQNATMNERTEQMCDELARMFGYQTLRILPSPDKSHLVYMIDGKSFRDREIGSGTQQFMHTAVCALTSEPTILLIDEPEISLHASMQSQFLSLLSKYAKQVIFTTHSIGLARSTTDAIYVGHKNKDGSNSFSLFNALPSLAEALGQLGHGGHRESTYKAVLLVEGVTDIKVFQALLALKQVMSEVVIVPLGGDAMASGKYQAELSELKRLGDNVFSIVDSEDEGNGPAKRRTDYKQVCDDLGIKCVLLKRRSIENYFPATAIAEVQPSVWNPSEFNQPPGDWKKDRNWRIAAKMKLADLDNTDLGSTLDSIAESLRSIGALVEEGD